MKLLRVLVPLAALLLAPMASACFGSSAAVFPSLEIKVPDKKRCIHVEDCDPVGAIDVERRYNGTIRWSWPVDYICMGDYAPPTGDMYIQFDPSAKNPSWMTITADPWNYTVTQAEQLDPRDDEFNQTTSTWTVVWEAPVNFTVTRTGIPTGDELQKLIDQEGMVKVTIKAKSTTSGGVQAAYTKSEFKYDARELLLPPKEENQESPPAPYGLLVVVLACAAAALRRR